MTDYTKATNFLAKDEMLDTNPSKVIRGSEFDTEFNNIATAVNSKSDYTEGTFTPVLRDSTSTTAGNSASTDSSVGRYVKIGRMVHATLALVQIDTTGLTSTSNAIIHGLPFPAHDSGTIMYWLGSMHMLRTTAFSGTNTGPWVPVIQDNTQYIRISANSAFTSPYPDQFLVSDLNDDLANIYITITYEAAS